MKTISWHWNEKHQGDKIPGMHLCQHQWAGTMASWENPCHHCCRGGPMEVSLLLLIPQRHFYYQWQGPIRSQPRTFPHLKRYTQTSGMKQVASSDKCCYFILPSVYLLGFALSSCQIFDFFPGVLTTCFALSFGISVPVWFGTQLTCPMLCVLSTSHDPCLLSNFEQVPSWSFWPCSRSLDSYLELWMLAYIQAW